MRGRCELWSVPLMLALRKHLTGLTFVCAGPWTTSWSSWTDIPHVHCLHVFPIAGGVIWTIDSAAFGDYGNCPQTMAEVSNIVRAQCLGQTSCTPHFNTLGYDPCPGHVKWMDAAWDCMPAAGVNGRSIAFSHTHPPPILLVMGLVLVALGTASPSKLRIIATHCLLFSQVSMRCQWTHRTSFLRRQLVEMEGMTFSYGASEYDEGYKYEK